MIDRIMSCLPQSLRRGPETAAFLTLAFSISSVMISLWVSERFLEAAIVAFIWCWLRDRRRWSFSVPFALPLSVFLLWTLFASVAAGENPVNRHTLGKFYILVVLFIVPPLVRGAGKAVWVYRAIFVAAAAASLMGLAQFIADPHRGLLDRITGFQSTWMNFSGQLMLVLVVLAAYAFCFGAGKRWWVPLLGLTLATPIALSLTRSAWAGTIIGLAAVVLLRRPRLAPGFAAVLLVLALASPGNIQQRFLTGLNPADPNTANRIELFQTSMRLIRDHPLVGVGPNSVEREALRYRGTRDYLDWMYQHMHNNFLQIAAERGIPGLLIWLWLMGRLGWDSWRVYRDASSKAASESVNAGNPEAMLASTAALGALLALLTMGMFEYNYGSSPVMLLFLFTVGAPYAFLDGAAAAGTQAGAPQQGRAAEMT